MSFRRLVRIVPLLLLLLPGIFACEHERDGPILIGFVGGLTGRTANLGIAGRDGVLLAVEEANRSGGIDGRLVELIIKNDRQDLEAGQRAVREMVAAGVPAIIGPMTSSMAVGMVPMLEQGKTLMLSPTASTTQLGRQDDHFLRIYPQCRMMAKALADHVYHDKGLRRFSIIYDLANRAFTENWKDCFTTSFKAAGGQIASTVSFSSGGSHRFISLVEKALAPEPDGLLILSNSLDTAMLAQQIIKLEKKIPVFTSEWSMTRDLLHSGGRSVEGLALFHTFNEASEKKSYFDFKKKYQARFKRQPSFAAIHAYDAAQIVLAGLRSGARTGPELKKAILERKSFETLQGGLTFDEYGDVTRNLYFTVVQNGQFVVIRQVSPSQE